MSNSSLAKVQYWTKNYSSRNGQKISTIIIHHMAGNGDAKSCYNVWKTRQGSAHYAISSKGEIGQLVDEKYRAWSVANAAADSKAVTMELANDGGASTSWHVSDKAIAACIALCVDICKRNGIKKLNFTGDTKGNLLMHRYFMATACPGPYLMGKFKYIADQVNKKLNASPEPTPAPTPTKTLYRVRKSWADSKSQVGAYTVLANAKKKADETGLNVYDESGKQVYSGKKATILYRVRKTWADSKSQVGAYTSLANAKKMCDKHPGYQVFDDKGKSVYKSAKIETIADKICAAAKDQTAWAYKSTYKWEGSPTIAKSKTKGTCVTYVACVLQRVGVISPGKYIWHDGSGYGTGKVYGAINSRMKVTYYNNKKSLDNLKSILKAGDIVLYDDNKSGNKGDGGHIEIYNGTNKSGYFYFYSGGTGSGHNTSDNRKQKGTRKVLAIVRVLK